jgi:hypothetical protein
LEESHEEDVHRHDCDVCVSGLRTGCGPRANRGPTDFRPTDFRAANGCAADRCAADRSGDAAEADPVDG